MAQGSMQLRLGRRQHGVRGAAAAAASVRRGCCGLGRAGGLRGGRAGEGCGTWPVRARVMQLRGSGGGVGGGTPPPLPPGVLPHACPPPLRSTPAPAPTPPPSALTHLPALWDSTPHPSGLPGPARLAPAVLAAAAGGPVAARGGRRRSGPARRAAGGGVGRPARHVDGGDAHEGE